MVEVASFAVSVAFTVAPVVKLPPTGAMVKAGAIGVTLQRLAGSLASQAPS